LNKLKKNLSFKNLYLIKTFKIKNLLTPIINILKTSNLQFYCNKLNRLEVLSGTSNFENKFLLK